MCACSWSTPKPRVEVQAAQGIWPCLLWRQRGIEPPPVAWLPCQRLILWSTSRSRRRHVYRTRLTAMLHPLATCEARSIRREPAFRVSVLGTRRAAASAARTRRNSRDLAPIPGALLRAAGRGVLPVSCICPRAQHGRIGSTQPAVVLRLVVVPRNLELCPRVLVERVRPPHSSEHSLYRRLASSMLVPLCRHSQVLAPTSSKPPTG
jgi:hypothetical protein